MAFNEIKMTWDSLLMGCDSFKQAVLTNRIFVKVKAKNKCSITSDHITSVHRSSVSAPMQAHLRPLGVLQRLLFILRAGAASPDDCSCIPSPLCLSTEWLGLTESGISWPAWFHISHCLCYLDIHYHFSLGWPPSHWNYGPAAWSQRTAY